MLICNCVISHQKIENENRKDKKMGRNRKRKCSVCKKRGELTSVKGTVMCFPCAIAISKMRTKPRDAEMRQRSYLITVDKRQKWDATALD